MKYFTPHEATQMLPLVRRIVEDIITEGTQLREYVQEVQNNVEGNPEFERRIRLINGYFKELEELGCLYKDWNFSIGLVDFPAVIDDEEVLLCWRSDEDKLEYYHSIEDGFSGRKRIPDELLQELIIP
ncbi:MAG: DUF2203 domain-containing protein [Bacteroidetes bacterium]|nr:DUF2203 domain-containing protein [Bacteroidota bacterium]